MTRALPLPLLLLSLWAGPALAQSNRPVPAGCKEDYSDCQEECSNDFGSSTRLSGKLRGCLGKCKQKLGVCRERHYTAQESGLAPGALDTPRAPDPAMEEPARHHGDSEEQPAASHEPAPSSEGTGRRGVYRASETRAADEPVKKPVAEPAPAPDFTSEETPVLPPPPPPKAEAKPVSGKQPKKTADTSPVLEFPSANEKPAKKPEPKAEAKAPETHAPVMEFPAAEEKPAPPAPKKVEPKPVASPERPALPPEPKKDISEWDPNGD